MLDVIKTTTFEYVQRADNIAADIRMWIFYRVTYTRLCGEMHHLVELLFGKQRIHRIAVCKVDAVH